jgi:sugar O-acyltransferase (sialic acid O-acetyltransferase NeuD family)
MAPEDQPYDRHVPVGERELVPIVGLGAGTHAKSVLEAIRSSRLYEVTAIVDDDQSKAGGEIFGTRIASADELPELRELVAHAFVGVGGIGDSAPRRAAFERLLTAGFELPPILHASATVSPWATLGRGVQALAGSIVNAGAEIGDDTIVNTGAIVEHDCSIGAHVHLAPGVRLAGLASVGEGAHVGIGAVVIEGVRIGAGALVGAGAVVLGDVPDGARVAGVPARPLG